MLHKMYVPRILAVTYLVRLLNNTMFNYNAVTGCVLVATNRCGEIWNGATATNAVFSTNDPSVPRTAGVAIIPRPASPPINPDETTRALSTPIF